MKIYDMEQKVNMASILITSATELLNAAEAHDQATTDLARSYAQTAMTEAKVLLAREASLTVAINSGK